MKIPDIVGINSKQALKNLAVVAIYYRTLIRFRNRYGEFEAEFRAAQADIDDPLAAFRAAHSLKGLAGTVGAEAVERAARALEYACQDNKRANEVDALLLDLLAVLNPVIKALEVLDS